MAEPTAPERALADIASRLAAGGRRFALVGGLAVSARGEVRFTRDVDVAVGVLDDTEAEQLVRELQAVGYQATATVEHEVAGRLAAARLVGPTGVRVDLLFASSGIESEIIERATLLELPGVGAIPVARAEELLAMKVLSMTEQRLQDRLDARRLVQIGGGSDLDIDAVRALLELITARGYHRDQDLAAKLTELLQEAARG